MLSNREFSELADSSFEAAQSCYENHDKASAFKLVDYICNVAVHVGRTHPSRVPDETVLELAGTYLSSFACCGLIVLH